MMYSQDGFGLGHFRRSETIARALQARAPDTRVLILADSPAPPFAPVPGIDFMKLPTIVKGSRSRWHPASLDIDINETAALRAQLIVGAYRGFAPDIVLVDHMPVGALGELKPMLGEIADGPRNPQLFLGLRDILDDGETIRRSWAELGAYDYLSSYESVLVYGSQDIYDVDAAYGLTPFVNELVYCNYVSRAQNNRAPVRASDQRPFVLMMGGGGHDASPLALAFLEAFPSVERAHDMEAVVIAGPTMTPEDRDRVLSYNDHPRMSVVGSVSDTQALSNNATALVTMGGYNSICEVLALGKNALVVPRAGPSHEQRLRSQLFAARGWIDALDPDELSSESLAGALDRLLSGSSAPIGASVPRLDGAERAAVRLLSSFPVSSNGQSEVIDLTDTQPLAPLAASTPATRSGGR